MNLKRNKVIPSAAERNRRKRYLSATLITCMVLLMVGGSLHVVQLGANRMADMRSLASYDLKEEHSRIRAAGEDIALHARNEANKTKVLGYREDELERLLTKDHWLELETMVTVESGPFLMGTDFARADDQDKPQHIVDLPAYRIDKYPVTNAQYARFVLATNYRPPLHWKDGKIPQGEALRPVTMVSWHDAQAYAKWAGKRLPTEQEWEKAARGKEGWRWPWGNKMDPSRLNTYYNVGSTTDVGSYPSGVSPYGAMDMAGNVAEWTADDFAPYPGSTASAELFKAAPAEDVNLKNQTDEQAVKVEGKFKVLRGGSWKSDPFSTSTYHRNYAWANYASDFYGFRLAADVPKGKGK